MAEYNDGKDQERRGIGAKLREMMGMETRSEREKKMAKETASPKEVKLMEKAERLRAAECAAKGGSYSNGKCSR